MINRKISSFLQEVNSFCDNEICVNETSIRDKNNYFLYKIELSDMFRKINIERIKRLYSIYKNDDYSKNVIIDDIKKLFYNSWDGAYSELIAYDLMNLIFEKPCKIQIDNMPIDKTLAKECKDNNVSAIDGYCDDGLIFFEIKTLTQRLSDLIYKLKRDLESRNSDNYFIFTSDYPMNLEIHGDCVYAKLKREILDAKECKKDFLCSKVIKGLNIKFYHEEKPIDKLDGIDKVLETTSVFVESHVCEDSFEMAKRLERLPLYNYKQFVDGMFMKIFVCHSLNINGSLICHRDFFRSLARRVFCKLTKEYDIFDDNSKLTTAEIAKHLSGIMFIVDNSTNEKIDLSNPKNLYKVYLYSNPNTDWSHHFIGFRNFCSVLNGISHECDDFEFDNY